MEITRTSDIENYTDNSEEYQDFPDGTHYLEPSQSEKDMIDLVCSNFDNVILVYNGANTLELGVADQYDSIKSVIWCPGAGQTGFNALGKIITGEINPSAKSTDTFVYDLSSSPYFNNIGDFAYTNADEFGFDQRGVFAVPHFVNYVEDIYVGYRFYETAAAEGLINYEDAVQYPFGYGLSYSTFDQKMSNFSDSDGVISFDVTVTNTGNVAGKDVVEAYYNPPYTNGGIEKSTANLIAFDKTDLLSPGESQTLSISFNEEDMASYDAKGNGCYVLEAGDYVISINKDSHDIIDSETVNINSDVIYNESNPRSTDETAAENAFEFAEGDNITYLSRADGFANYDEATKAPENYEMSDEIKSGLFNSANWDPNDYNNESDEMPSQEVDNGLTLADLRGADYDDERWELLLDEMSIEIYISCSKY